MKKFFLSTLTILLFSLVAQAQDYRQSRYYDSETGRLKYYKPARSNRLGVEGLYCGLRLGAAFSTVGSDDKALDGGDSQAGLTFGVIFGMQLSNDTPVILESGLLYAEKGGKNTYDGKKMTYDLNYLEMPIVLKYAIGINEHFSVQPLLGGYFAYGISGKVKNFGDRESSKSFSKHYFKRFDGGLRLGCGVAYDLLYADITYDLGLANISHDEFDAARNHCWSINIGVNF